MTEYAWDFSAFKPSVEQFKAGGIRVAIIYLHNDWRGFKSNLSGLAYCNTLRAAGILVEGVYEASAGELTTRPALGFNHGQEARRVARAWGFPDWQRLIAATDVNLAPNQYGARADYQREFNRGTGGFGTGYDEADAIDYMYAQGVLTGGTAWQSGAASWSRDSGQWRLSPHAWMLQLGNRQTSVPGVPANAVDDNKLILPYPTGGFPEPPAPQQDWFDMANKEDLKDALVELATGTDEKAQKFQWAIARSVAGVIAGEDLTDKDRPRYTLNEIGRELVEPNGGAGPAEVGTARRAIDDMFTKLGLS